MTVDPTTVIVAVVAAVLGAPFLNFLLNMTRARADKDSAIATGTGMTVKAMQEAIDGLRQELKDVRSDLREAREEIEAQEDKHRERIREIRAEHRREIAEIRAEHRREMSELESRLRTDLG